MRAQHLVCQAAAWRLRSSPASVCHGTAVDLGRVWWWPRAFRPKHAVLTGTTLPESSSVGVPCLDQLLKAAHLALPLGSPAAFRQGARHSDKLWWDFVQKASSDSVHDDSCGAFHRMVGIKKASQK